MKIKKIKIKMWPNFNVGLLFTPDLIKLKTKNKFYFIRNPKSISKISVQTPDNRNRFHILTANEP